MSDSDLMLAPTTIDELQSAVREHPRVLPVGGGTKSRLTAVATGDGDDLVPISTRKLTGITEYEPSEYTFTALAGTPVKEISEALDAKGQFLPCSALLQDAGATLGGSIASGLSGSGRFRFGGIRDFLLGIRYVSGEAKCISSGGKVVKNAAGFDLPKFMVGSLGRYGILAEATFKVFPKPSASITMRVACDTHEQALDRLLRAASSRWELYAVDYSPGDGALYLRLGGPPDPIQSLADEIAAEWSGATTQLTDAQASNYWTSVREFSWMPERGALAKVPMMPKQIPALQSTLERHEDVHTHFSVAGNVAYVATPSPRAMTGVSEQLEALSLRGLALIGGADAPLWLGDRREDKIATALKDALDPMGRFPSLDA